MENIKRHSYLLSNHLFLVYRVFPFSLTKTLLKKNSISSEVEQKEFSERGMKTHPSPALHTTYSPVTHFQLCWLLQGLFTETFSHGAIMLFLHKPMKLRACPHSTKKCREQDGHTGTVNSHIKNQTTLFMRGTALVWENAAIAVAIPSLIPYLRQVSSTVGTFYFHLS